MSSIIIWTIAVVTVLGLVLAGLALFGVMYTLFRMAMRHYRSTGS